MSSPPGRQDRAERASDVVRAGADAAPSAAATSPASPSPAPPASPSPASAGSPGRARRAAAWLVEVALGNAEGAVYGAIMIGVLLATEDARRETYGETFAATAIVVGLYWTTKLYTDVLGVRLRTQEPLDGALIRRRALHELPVIEGAVTPIVVLLVAWALGASLTRGVRVATVATAISIVALEIAAGWRVRPHGAGIWLRALGGAVVGLAVVSVKVVLHV